MKFIISNVEKGENIRFSYEHANVTEALFWRILENTVRLETIEFPDKLEDNLKFLKEHILSKSGVGITTVGNLGFEISK
jgi:hypothetical protein